MVSGDVSRIGEYKHQEFQFPLLNAVHCGTESEHQVLNDSHIFVSFTGILLLFGTKFQYSCKRRQDDEGKHSDKASIRDLVLTFCSTMRSVQQRKLKLLMLVLGIKEASLFISAIQVTCECSQNQ